MSEILCKITSCLLFVSFFFPLSLDVGQFLTNIRMILQSLLSQYSGKTIVEKISNSVFAMATRQLVSEYWSSVLYVGSVAIVMCVLMTAVFSSRSSSCWIFAL